MDKWRNHFFLEAGRDRGDDLREWGSFAKEVFAAFLWTAGAVLIVLILWLIFAT